jgi:hypothetical protein
VPEFWASVRHNGGHYAAFLISFFVTTYAWVMWIVVPLLVSRWSHLRRRRRDREAASPPPG